jgi:hypothetical protein
MVKMNKTQKKVEITKLGKVSQDTLGWPKGKVFEVTNPGGFHIPYEGPNKPSRRWGS